MKTVPPKLPQDSTTGAAARTLQSLQRILAFDGQLGYTMKARCHEYTDSTTAC